MTSSAGLPAHKEAPGVVNEEIKKVDDDDEGEDVDDGVGSTSVLLLQAR
jgi:hypothetical protein